MPELTWTTFGTANHAQRCFKAIEAAVIYITKDIENVYACRDKKPYLKAFFVQVAILSNHQNGRDTHVRQVKAFGPRYEATQFQGGQLHFNTPEFASYAGLR